MAHIRKVVSRTERVSFRVYPAIKQALVKAAQGKGVTLTEYLEPLLLRALRKDGAKLTHSVTIDLAKLLEESRA